LLGSRFTRQRKSSVKEKWHLKKRGGRNQRCIRIHLPPSWQGNVKRRKRGKGERKKWHTMTDCFLAFWGEKRKVVGGGGDRSFRGTLCFPPFYKRGKGKSVQTLDGGAALPGKKNPGTHPEKEKEKEAKEARFLTLLLVSTPGEGKGERKRQA